MPKQLIPAHARDGYIKSKRGAPILAWKMPIRTMTDRITMPIKVIGMSVAIATTGLNRDFQSVAA